MIPECDPPRDELLAGRQLVAGCREEFKLLLIADDEEDIEGRLRRVDAVRARSGSLCLKSRRREGHRANDRCETTSGERKGAQTQGFDVHKRVLGKKEPEREKARSSCGGEARPRVHLHEKCEPVSEKGSVESPQFRMARNVLKANCDQQIIFELEWAYGRVWRTLPKRIAACA